MPIRALRIPLFFLWAAFATAALGQGAAPSGGAAPAGGAPSAFSPGVPLITNTQPGGTDAGAGAQGGSRAIQGGSAARTAEEAARATAAPRPEVEVRNEFQQFVSVSLGQTLPLFGYNLFSDAPSTFAPVDQVPVTPDYVIGPGDEIVVRAWGQVDIDYRVAVDRNGAIYIPQVGTLTVGGLRYQDLHGFMRNAIGRVFRNFELSVMLGKLRSVQIFVVGQAKRPGAYTVSSLSTLVNAIFFSGGPAATGSMRRIQLKRGENVVTEFDVYDLLLRGDKSKDTRLLPGDVIYIPPIGDLVAISGSVNQPAIFELKGETSLDTLIQLAGGLSIVAAGQKVTVERISDRRTRQVDEFTLDANGLARQVRGGDLVQVAAVSPRFENAVTIRGAVASPGRFPWFEGMRVKDVIPDRESLIVPDYWQRLNLAPRRAQPGGEPRISTDQQRAILEELRSRQAQQRGLMEDPRGRTDPRAAAFLAGGGADDAKLKMDPQRAIADEAKLRGPDQWAPSDELRFRTEVKQRFEEINWDYAIIERLNYTDLTTLIIPFNLGRAVLEGDASHNLQLRPGDVVTVFSKTDIQVPVAKQTKFVRLEGELAVPGVYQARPGETLRQLVTRVGGFSPNAYLYGAEFSREAVRVQQQKRLDEAIDRLAQDIERTATVRTQTASDAPEAVQSQAESQRRLVARLREIRATGRIVLETRPEAREVRDLPDTPLEDGDRLFVPPKPSTVGVIGSVYSQTVLLYDAQKRLPDYLEQAGGFTRSADKGRTYVVRADGSVTGRAQPSGLFGSFLGSERVNPGDTIVVPEDLDRFVFTKALKDWTQIFYQLGLGVAALKVLRDF